MNTDKLNKIIKERNEHREYQTLKEAEGIIEDIVAKQNQIESLRSEILELQGELKALEVQQIDPTAVLGGE